LVATVTAPPRRVVSRPPLAVVRVAQPEARRRAAREAERSAERRSGDFMGAVVPRRAVDGTLWVGRSFARSRWQGGAGAMAGAKDAWRVGADLMKENENENENEAERGTRRREELDFQGGFVAEEVGLPGEEVIVDFLRGTGDLGELGAVGDESGLDAEFLGDAVAV